MAYVKITNFAIKDSTNDVIRGTEHDDEYNAIEASFTAQPSATQTLTNKTIALGSNTVSGTTAQFNTALTDGDFATLAGSETLTNKALNGSLGATTPSTVVATDLTTTGNTILGNASTDTLNVGNGDLIKDASGNVGIGVTPSAWGASYTAIDFGNNGAIFNVNNAVFGLTNNAYYTGTDWLYKINSYSTFYATNAVSGVHSWYTAPSGTAGNPITFTQVLAVEKDKSLALQGATSQTGAGITFPATQSASTDANTLDDYEEGTWTPTLDSGGCSGTAYYTKIGRQVTVKGTITWTSNGAGGVGVTINNLPFAAATSTYGFAGWVGMVLDASDTQSCSFINANSSLVFSGFPSGSGIDASRWLTGASLIFNVTYFV